MDQISQIISSPWFNATLGLIGAIGVVISIIFYYASRENKELTYDLKILTILKNFENKINGLEISYKNTPIENLVSTRIGIWNKGRKTIRREDIARKNSLRVYVDGDIVGDAEISFMNNESNEINIHQKDNYIEIDFLYLEHKDGAVIQVFHTGNFVRGSRIVRVEGKIIDQQAIQRTFPNSSKTLFPFMLFFYIGAIINSVIFTLAIRNSELYESPKGTIVVEIQFIWVLLSSILTFIIFTIIFFWAIGRKSNKKKSESIADNI